MTPYQEKLRNPMWQKKRLKIFERDQWRCTECGNDKLTLHVHHERYEGDPWDIPDDDLKTLCETCHNKKADKLIQISNFVKDCGYHVLYLHNIKMNEDDKDHYMLGFE